MIQDENIGIGEELAEPVINLAAAIQLLSCITANISLLAGPDVAFDAVMSVLAARKEIEKGVDALRRSGIPGIPPPEPTS